MQPSFSALSCSSLQWPFVPCLTPALNPRAQPNLRSLVTCVLLQQIAICVEPKCKSHGRRALLAGSNYDLQVVFRVCQLWFSQNSEEDTNAQLSSTFETVSSHKFLPLVYQIASRINALPLGHLVRDEVDFQVHYIALCSNLLLVQVDVKSLPVLCFYILLRLWVAKHKTHQVSAYKSHRSCQLQAGQAIQS